MATKYMGAKLLQKKLEAERKANAKRAVKTKGTNVASNQEYLERKKRHFDLSASSMQIEGDFAIADEEGGDENPEYNKAFDSLRKNEYFLLTFDEDLLDDEDQLSETDDEQDEI